LGTARALGALLAFTSTRTRLAAAGGGVLGLAGRLLVVGMAVQIAQRAAEAATLAGVLVGVLFAIQRVLFASARVGVECDLHRAAARGLVRGDVLRVPAEGLDRVVFEANHHARHLLAERVPVFAGDAAASLAVLPVLVQAFAPRLLVTAALGVGAVIASLALFRGVTARMQQRVLAASEEVVDGLLVAVEGRLELAARGGEPAFERGFDRTLARYAALAERAAFGSALVGRAPLAIGAAVVAAAVVVDGGSRAALASAALADALVLAACLPALLGAVLGAHEIVRTTALARPLIAIAGAPPRAELAAPTSEPPPAVELPARVVADAVAFAYEDGAPDVVRDLSFEWSPPLPLVLLGPNGSGKSTVLRLLLGLRPPSSGSLLLGGRDLTRVDLAALRRSAAYLPQRPYLGEPYSSVRAAMLLGQPDASDAAMLLALERTGLLGMLGGRTSAPLSVRVGELSAGQRQRLALARILVHNARFILLDEPDANLDRAGIALLAGLVRDLVADGKMVAIAAHTAELSDVSPLRVTLAPRER
jgi:ABC-type multidrug transport system fused ATPase/permease subunit